MTRSLDRPSILVVCTGNVCRSPYIERRLQHELDTTWGAGAVRVHSAGTGALAGHPMDQSSSTLLERLGVRIADFVARDITRDLIAESSLVLTATRAHRTAVTRMHPRALRTTHALRDLAHLAPGVELPSPDVSPQEWFDTLVPRLAARRGVDAPLAEDQADIVDPFRQGPEVFERMAAEVEAGLPAIMRVLAPQRR